MEVGYSGNAVPAGAEQNGVGEQAHAGTVAAGARLMVTGAELQVGGVVGVDPAVLEVFVPYDAPSVSSARVDTKGGFSGNKDDGGAGWKT